MSQRRIGINLGDVRAEDDDILGDGVNVASRLEGISEAGGICISEDAYRQVGARSRPNSSTLESGSSRTLPGRCGSIA
jgi:class 3 adenylate cyclase